MMNTWPENFCYWIKNVGGDRCDIRVLVYLYCFKLLVGGDRCDMGVPVYLYCFKLLQQLPLTQNRH